MKFQTKWTAKHPDDERHQRNMMKPLSWCKMENYARYGQAVVGEGADVAGTRAAFLAVGTRFDMRLSVLF
jgi:hypothetical protein